MKKHLVDQKVKTLDELGLEFGTDKASSHHDYLKTYEKYFERYREQRLMFLEIGFGGHENPDEGGESIRTWLSYAPNWDIHCIELHNKNHIPFGCNFWQTSQDDRQRIESMFTGFVPFDIIIDDGSHLSSLTIKSFEILFPMMAKGGVYVVEDSHSSYHDWFYGMKEAHPNPSKNGTQGLTAMNYFKRLADSVNNDLLLEQYRFPYQIESITFLKDLIIITKL